MGPMIRLGRLAGKLRRCSRGATAVEYGFILSLIVVALVFGIATLGGSAQEKWRNISDKVGAVEP